MKNLTIWILYLVTISTGCTKTEENHFIVNAPKIIEYKTSDTTITRAVENVINHLKGKHVPLDSLYFSNIEMDTNEQTIIFRIDHYRTFKMIDYYDNQRKYIDSISKIDSNRDLLIDVPPTGNWSGYDRTIIYSISKNTITEFIDQ